MYMYVFCIHVWCWKMVWKENETHCKLMDSMWLNAPQCCDWQIRKNKNCITTVQVKFWFTVWDTFYCTVWDQGSWGKKWCWMNQEDCN